MAKRFLILFLSLLLSGCFADTFGTVDPPRTKLVTNEYYHQIVEAVVRAWQEDASLPSVNTEDCKRETLTFGWLNDQDFTDLSMMCPPPPQDQYCANYWQGRCVYGCAFSFMLVRHRGLAPKLHPVHEHFVGVSERLKAYSNVGGQLHYALRHETVHFLSHCTDHERSSIEVANGTTLPYFNADGQHKDPRLWTGPSSVIERSVQYAPDIQEE